MDAALWILLAQYLISNCVALDSITAREAANTTIPAALVIPPSQYFEGNDGPWSTFNLRVGTPEQDVRVLISTTSPETIVVLSEYGCSTKVFQDDDVPSNCANSRGMMFNPNTSTTWNDQGFFGINQDGIGLEANLGYMQAADFGLDTLGLGFVSGGNGPTLKNQTIAGIASASPFYLGIFGLSAQPTNFSTLGNSSSPSYFQSLKDANLIPSLSWSYTAGAVYRLKKVYGQLIFGGYDTSRFVDNIVSFDLAGDVSRDIVLSLQSITYSGNTQSSLLDSPIQVFIDSTDPNIWLPESVCKAFEDAFSLTLDSDSGLYLVNDSHHDTLLAGNAQVSFRLSDSLTGGSTVTIVLPYSAFDLQAGYPLGQNLTSYFPLKKAANDTQYTLGRTFLQEAYLTVDYERGNFSVSQCSWVADAKQQVVTINSKDYKAPSETSGAATPNSSTSAAKDKTTPPTATIVGIVVGVIVLTSLVAGALIFLRCRRKRRQSGAQKLGEGDVKWAGEHALETLRKTHGELSNDSQINQLHSEQKAFEGQEMEANWVKAPVHELVGTQVNPAELESPRGSELDAAGSARVPWKNFGVLGWR